MNIIICGSMTFAKQMKEIKQGLEKLGHNVILPVDTEMCISDPLRIDNLDANYRYCIENNIMKEHFEFIEKADAVLILNHKKNDIDGYVGTSTLMELALAHYFDKKIFLLNDLPDPREARWAHEVRIMQPKVIKGDLTKIK